MSGIVGSVGTRTQIVGHTNAGTLGAGIGFTALVGTIAPFGSTTLPAGWLAADGSSVSRTTYAVLFAIIGTAWGSASGSTFNLPDCDAAFLRGTGTSAGFSHSNPTVALVTKVNHTFTTHGHQTQQGGILASWIAEYCSYHQNCYASSPPVGANSDNTAGPKDTTAFSGETQPNSIGVKYIIKYI